VHPRNASLLYNLACMEALLGEKNAALDHLAEAVENPRFREFAATDRDLDSLRDDPRFRELVSPRA
jgi:hypothetical protein